MVKTLPKDDIRLWHDRGLGVGGIDLLAARCHGHRFKAHAHSEIVIACFNSGAQLHRVGRREGVAVRGSVLIIPEAQEHVGSAAAEAEGWSYRAFYPDPQTLQSLFQELFSGSSAGSPDFGAEPLFDDWAAASRLIALHRTIETYPDDLLLRQQAFATAMGIVLSSYARTDRPIRRPAGEPQAVARGREYARARFADPQLRIEHLAAAAGLSQFHFMRVFRAAAGVTAHSYIVQLRLACARNMLARGASAAEAAYASGFADQSHLIRHFRAVLGVTPGRYAARSQSSRASAKAATGTLASPSRV